jgi:hypothetical protein
MTKEPRVSHARIYHLLARDWKLRPQQVDSLSTLEVAMLLALRETGSGE